MRWLAGFSLAAVLAGCATPAERAAQAEREIDEMIQVYGPACERLGYRGGTDPWRDCVLRLNANETYRRTPATTTCFGHRGFFHCSTY
ncbi:MAG: hypothetical protein EPO27_16540 [Betaproteobacteria bacterium]|nr:MAG: hypothetical protein EPO27_16540 [Betaproteobacteria bacterium]